MIKNKNILLSFLLLAWAIIFAHSVVPHNHHFFEQVSECTHEHSHDLEYEVNAEVHDCDHDCNDQACHFHVDILAQVSIDDIFTISSKNTYLNYFSLKETKTFNYFVEFVSNKVPKTNYLRGPPITS